MRVQICAVGRLKNGPERSLVEDYRSRFDRTGRPLGLGPLAIHEVDERKGGGPGAEALLLERAVPSGALVCVLDERGKVVSSPEFAEMLAAWRDQGRQDVSFLIGGADGIEAGLRGRADAALSFGPMVWPHMLARAMLCEQLYRAAGILAGTPYHRS